MYNFGSETDNDRYWTSQLPYVLGVSGTTLYVGAGTTLTIEPGAVIKFYRTGAVSNRALRINGILSANGTAEKPIYFTSLYEDSVGAETHPEWFSSGNCITGMPCDVNNDGGATTPGTDDWGQEAAFYGGLVFTRTDSSCQANGTLNHVILRYARRGIYMEDNNLYTPNSAVTISNSTIENCSSHGIYVYRSNPTVSNLTIRNNVGSAIYLYSFNYNTNVEFAGVQDVHHNGINGVQLYDYSASLDTNRNWYNDLPYYYYGAGHTINLNNGVTLTMEPGTILKFHAADATDREMRVYGTLNATGTATNPIYFTSGNDDTVGAETHQEWFSGGVCRTNYPCDTNNDGTATSAAAGDWGYNGESLHFFSSAAGVVASGTLDYVTVRYGQWGIGVAGHNVYSTTTEPIINHTTIENGSSHGMYIYQADPAVSNMTIRNNAGSAIMLYSNVTGTNVRLAGTHDVHDNNINGVFLNNYGSTNQIDTTRTYYDDLPYYFGSEANGDTLYVNAGVTLTIEPGAIFKFYHSATQSDKTLIVNGTLNAIGTAVNPIYFTSGYDDTVGVEAHPNWFVAGVCRPNYPCDTNNNGACTPGVNCPEKEQWGAIEYAPSSSGRLDYVNFRYGAGGSNDYDYLLTLDNMTGTNEISNCKFNYANRGMLVRNSNLNIHNNQFISSSDYGIIFDNPPTGTIFEYNTISGFNTGVRGQSIANGLTLRYNNIDAITYYVQNTSVFTDQNCGDSILGTGTIDACVNTWGAYPVSDAPAGKIYKNPGEILYGNVGVELTAPDGSEDWEEYSHHDITWTTTDIGGVVAKADLYYSIDNGLNWILIESELSHAGTPTINGTYNWQIPVVEPSDECLIKINVKNSSGIILGSDISDYPFTISAFSGTFPPEEETLSSTVTASVPSSLTFDINPVASGSVNGATIDTPTASILVDFGTFTSEDNRIAAQDLVVTTNATNGFVVTLQATDNFDSATDTIPFFVGTNNIPTLWNSPPGSGTEGYFGYTTNDATLSTNPARFISNKWAGFATSPAEVFFHNEPTDGTGVGMGITRVGYQLELTSMQSSGVYEVNVIYIATATY
jgi:hypothetical protein